MVLGDGAPAGLLQENSNVPQVLILQDKTPHFNKIAVICKLTRL